MVRRAEQEKSGVDRVDGIMPDQRRHDAEAQHDESDDHAGHAHFHSANKERLIGVGGMKESPVERRQHQSQRPGTRKLLQEGDGKGAELHLFRKSRQRTNVKSRHPGQARVEFVGELGLGGRPGPELVSRKIEDGLISKEEEGQPNPHHIGHEERARAEPLPTEAAAQ